MAGAFTPAIFFPEKVLIDAALSRSCEYPIAAAMRLRYKIPAASHNQI